MGRWCGCSGVWIYGENYFCKHNPVFYQVAISSTVWISLYHALGSEVFDGCTILAAILLTVYGIGIAGFFVWAVFTDFVIALDGAISEQRQRVEKCVHRNDDLLAAANNITIGSSLCVAGPAQVDGRPLVISAKMRKQLNIR